MSNQLRKIILKTLMNIHKCKMHMHAFMFAIFHHVYQDSWSSIKAPKRTFGDFYSSLFCTPDAYAINQKVKALKFSATYQDETNANNSD